MRDRAWLGEMAAIWASGYLEAAFRDTLRQYVETRADTRVQRAMSRRLERFRNPRLGVILDLVGEFDTAWEDELRSLADGAVGESVNSIVALRHRVAHGRSDRVSIGTVGRYFDEARRLPRRLVASSTRTCSHPLPPAPQTPGSARWRSACNR